jgi:Predicted membrane protein
VASARDVAPEPPLILLQERRATVTLDLVLPFAAVLSGVFAAIHVLSIELPIDRFGNVLPPEMPFTDDGAVATIILTVAVLASGAVVGGALARRVSILIAGGVAAYAVPFEVYAWAVSVLWVGLGGLGLVMARVDRAGRPAFLIAATGVVVVAAIVAVGIVAPSSRLVVGSVALSPVVLLQSIASLGAVIAGLIAIARSGRGQPWARWAWIGGGITVVYLFSTAVVGAIATQVGGSIATDELRTQGQVALSVLWAVLGLASFVAGLRVRSDDLRHGGLALLALATAKVFLFDLSALDVAYRVISLIALGLLLLASAWLWQRLQSNPQHEADGPPI